MENLGADEELNDILRDPFPPPAAPVAQFPLSDILADTYSITALKTEKMKQKFSFKGTTLETFSQTIIISIGDTIEIEGLECAVSQVTCNDYEESKWYQPVSKKTARSRSGECFIAFLAFSKCLHKFRAFI